MGARKALAGKGNTRRWKGREKEEEGRREEGKEGSSFPGRIGRKLLQPGRAVPAAPLPPGSRAHPGPGDAPNPRSLPRPLCHGSDRDVTGKGNKGLAKAAAIPFSVHLDALKAFFVSC